MVTHVGLCTHRTDVQGRLPQIFIGNHRCFTQDLMDAIVPDLPRTLRFWRRKSSWNTSALMQDVLQEIRTAMDDFPNLQPILVMDCASIHITTEVLRKASSLNLWVLLVPARTTYALQPLDTHAFSPYKAFLKRAYRDSKNEDGIVTAEAWARTLITAATIFLCGRKWAHAFHQTGILGNRSCLTRELKAIIGTCVAAPGSGVVSMPSVRALRSLFPVNRRLPYCQLLNKPLGRRVRLRLF